MLESKTQSRGNLAQFTEEMIRQESLVQVFNAQNQAIENYKYFNEIYSEASQKAIFMPQQLTQQRDLLIVSFMLYWQV